MTGLVLHLIPAGLTSSFSTPIKLCFSGAELERLLLRLHINVGCGHRFQDARELTCTGTLGVSVVCQLRQLHPIRENWPNVKIALRRYSINVCSSLMTSPELPGTTPILTRNE